MNECYLDDDGGLGSDFIAVEGIPDGIGATSQSLWIGVRPLYYGNAPPEEPMIHTCYQEAHMGSLPSGPVWITPAV